MNFLRKSEGGFSCFPTTAKIIETVQKQISNHRSYITDIIRVKRNDVAREKFINALMKLR